MIAQATNRPSMKIGSAMTISGRCVPPRETFGKLMSVSDVLMWRYYDLLSFRASEEVAGYKREIAGGRNPRIEGFIVSDFIARFPEAFAELVGEPRRRELDRDDAVQLVARRPRWRGPRCWRRFTDLGTQQACSASTLGKCTWSRSRLVRASRSSPVPSSRQRDVTYGRHRLMTTGFCASSYGEVHSWADPRFGCGLVLTRET